MSSCVPLLVAHVSFKTVANLLPLDFWVPEKKEEVETVWLLYYL